MRQHDQTTTDISAYVRLIGNDTSRGWPEALLLMYDTPD